MCSSIQTPASLSQIKLYIYTPGQPVKGTSKPRGPLYTHG